MNALADKVHKQKVPSTQLYALYTLVLLLIARTNFSDFSDDWHNHQN